MREFYLGRDDGTKYDDFEALCETSTANAGGPSVDGPILPITLEK